MSAIVIAIVLAVIFTLIFYRLYDWLKHHSSEVPIFLHAGYQKEIAEKYSYEIEIPDSSFSSFNQAEGIATFKFGYYSKAHLGEIARMEVGQQLSKRKDIKSQYRPEAVPRGKIGAIAVNGGNIEMTDDYTRDTKEYGLVPFTVPVNQIKKRIDAYEIYLRKYPFKINEPKNNTILISASLTDENCLSDENILTKKHQDFLPRYRLTLKVKLQLNDSLAGNLEKNNIKPKITQLQLEWPYLDALPYYSDEESPDGKSLINTDSPRYNPETRCIEWVDKPKVDKNKKSADEKKNNGAEELGKDNDHNKESEKNDDNATENKAAENQENIDSKSEEKAKKENIDAVDNNFLEPNKEIERFFEIANPSIFFEGFKTRGKLVIEIPDTLLSGTNWKFYNMLGEAEEEKMPDSSPPDSGGNKNSVSKVKRTSTIEVNFSLDMAACFKSKEYIHHWQIEVEGVLPEVNRTLVIEQVLRDQGVIVSSIDKFNKNPSDTKKNDYLIKGKKSVNGSAATFFIAIYRMEDSEKHIDRAARMIQLDEVTSLKYLHESEKIRMDFYVRFHGDYRSLSRQISSIHILLKERLSSIALR